MITLPEAMAEIKRMSGLKNYPWQPEAEMELAQQARRARSMEHLSEIVSGWLAGNDEAPTPASIKRLILGPSTPRYREPDRTQCQCCGDSGWEPRYVLRTARPGGAGYEVQPVTESEYNDLQSKVDWQKQTVYCSVRPCRNGCRASKPINDPSEAA